MGLQGAAISALVASPLWTALVWFGRVCCPADFFKPTATRILRQLSEAPLLPTAAQAAGAGPLRARPRQVVLAPLELQQLVPDDWLHAGGAAASAAQDP